MITVKRLALWGTVMLVAIAPGCFNRSTTVSPSQPSPTESVSESVAPSDTASPEVSPPAAESPEDEASTAAAPAPPEPEPAPPAEAPANCEEALTQAEINVCAQQSYEAADRELNRVYQQLRDNLSPEEREELRQAELEWIEYRDANCEAESSEYEGGSLQPTIRYGCLEELTRNRTAELQEQLEASS
jgi:uncharacterized protein YecT (DUF1311 family)